MTRWWVEFWVLYLSYSPNKAKTSLREAFIDNYRLALNSENFGKFIENCFRLLEVARRIVTKVREYYDRSLSLKWMDSATFSR